MRFIVIENFSEKVDPEERNLRLYGVRKAVKRYRTASKIARSYKHPSKKYGGGPTHLARIKASHLTAKAAAGEELIKRYRPGRRGRKPFKRLRSATQGKRYYGKIVRDLTKRGYAPVRPSFSRSSS